MPDREKVINGLTACVDDMCDDCPYYDEEVPDCDYYGRCNRIDMNRDALALLREPEPVKPTAKDEAIRIEYNCGKCGYLVGFVSTIHDDMQYRATFCPECGRKVKWDA